MTITNSLRVALHAILVGCGLTIVMAVVQTAQFAQVGTPEASSHAQNSRSAGATLPQRVLPLVDSHSKRVASKSQQTDNSLHAQRVTMRSPRSDRGNPFEYRSSGEFQPQTRQFAKRGQLLHPRPEKNNNNGGVMFRQVPLQQSRDGQTTTQYSHQLASLQQQINKLALAQQQQQTDGWNQAQQLIDAFRKQNQSTGLMQQQLKQIEALFGKDNQVAADAPKPAAPALSETGPLEADTAATPETNSIDDAERVLTATPTTPGGESFSFQIENAEIADVLDMFGQLSGHNILLSSSVSGPVTANLADVSVQQAFQALLKSRGYEAIVDGGFVYVMTRQEADERKKLTRKLLTKVYRPHYISVADLETLITPLITPDIGTVAVTTPAEVGIGSNSESAGGNSLSQSDALLVQDYEQVIAEIDAVLAEMDVPPMQVVIEAMILNVRLDDSMEFGINFALLSSNNNNLIVSGNGSALNQSSGFPGTRDSLVPPVGQFVADAAGLKYGFIQGDMSAFINALEGIADTNLIASPQLRVLNKQRAELIIGDRISYKTLAFNGTQTVENVNFLDSGTKLLIRPFAAPDGLVRMEIHPERSSAVIDNTTGLPNQATTEVTTNVMVRDGTTIVIGGLIEEQIVESAERIPLLGALPVVGNAFQNKAESIFRSELIVLITPRIVREEDAITEGEVAQYENEDRVNHFRDNLSAVNRRNLARVEYERAQYYFDRGQLEKASQHIEKSLRHSKNNLEALRLKKAIDAARPNWTRLKLKMPWSKPDETEWVVEPTVDADPDEFELPPLPAAEPAATP